MIKYEEASPLRDDGFDDDDSLDGEDGEHKLFVENFSNALILIDHNADLDSVLSAKTIGDALQILCPNMPGLPTKTRGKYLKRKHLNPVEKEMLMKYQNRDNARRTRKRKKLYDYFLKKLLSEIEEILHPIHHISNGVSGISAIGNGATNSLQSHQLALAKIMADDRIDKAQKFLRVRMSNQPDLQDWRSLSRPDINYSAPGIFRDTKECRGIDTLIEESIYRKLLCEKIIRSKGSPPGQVTWMMDFEILPDEIILGASGSHAVLAYEWRVFEAPLLPSGALTNQSFWSSIWSVHVYCKLSFASDGHIGIVCEQFDVSEILRQTKIYLSHSTNGIRLASGAQMGMTGGAGGIYQQTGHLPNHHQQPLGAPNPSNGMYSHQIQGSNLAGSSASGMMQY